MTSIILLYQLENLSTNLYPYLDNAIITLNTLIAYLYNNNTSQAVRVVEVKKGVKRVNTKLNNIKTTFKAQVDEVKAQVNEVDKKVNEVDKKVNKVDKKVNKVKTDVADIKMEIKLLKNCLKS